MPISSEVEIKKKMMPMTREFIKKTQKERKEEGREFEAANVMRRTKTRQAGGHGGPWEDSKCDVACGHGLHPLFQVEETSSQSGLHAVSDTSRWMNVCPTTGFTRLQLLDSGATDSCAPDSMCLEVKSRPSEGSRRESNVHCSR